MIVKAFLLIIAAAAAYMDLRYAKVKNALIIAGFAAGLVLRLIFAGAWTKNYAGTLTFLFRPEFSLNVFLEGLAGAAVPFVILYFFYHLRLIGAGDVKIFCVAGLFSGPKTVLFIMLITFFLAAAASFCIAAGRGRLKEVLAGRVHVAVYMFFPVLLWMGGVLT